MNTEIVSFRATDGVLNDGYIIKNGSQKIIISIHGMSSNCFKVRDEVISKKAIENGFDYMAFNNRGSELVKYIRKDVDGKEIKLLGGTTYEDPLEGYFDIKGAIEKAIELGYKEIYLQGHSLGTTKIVYTYNRLKNENYELIKNIKGIILLSLVDIPRAVKIFLNEKYESIIKLAEEKENKKEYLDLMPPKSFIHPMCVKTFLRYGKYNKELDFAQYSKKEFNFEELNNITVPLFMRWGNSNEMIEQNAEILVQNVNRKINNKNKDINYIDGADHGYTGKEEILANEIINFLNKESKI